MIRIFTIAIVLVFLVSCSDALYSEESGVSLKQCIYVVPEHHLDDITSTVYPVNNIIVEKGQSLKFVAGYSINNELSTSDTTAKYYTSVHWIIDGETFYTNTFRYTFQKTGRIQGELRTIDLFGDTLVSDITIFVNTPEKFTIDFPNNGYNLAEPSKKVGLPFKWTFTGIDEWESANCEIFLSEVKTNVWSSSLGTTDCRSEATLWGPLVGDSSLLSSFGIDLRKEYYTFYWGIKYTVYIDGNRKYADSTDIHHFTTKFLDDDRALLYIPFIYKSMRFWDSVQTRITIVSANGDTLASIENTSPETMLNVTLKPQSGVIVYFDEKQRPDYKADSIQIDLPPGAVVFADTTTFTDRVPPQIATVDHFIENGDFAKFILYDDGAGINAQKTRAYIDQDSVSLTFRMDTLMVLPTCSGECILSIQGEDYARNSLPELYWSLVKKSEGFEINGPYRKTEDLP